MTGFNKTLDMNLEHTGLGYTHIQSINISSFIRKEENTKVGLFSADLGCYSSTFRALVRTFFDTPMISGPCAFNDV